MATELESGLLNLQGHVDASVAHQQADQIEQLKRDNAKLMTVISELQQSTQPQEKGERKTSDTVAVDEPLGDLLEQLERKGKTRSLQSFDLRSSHKGHIAAKVKTLNLSATKRRQAETLATKLKTTLDAKGTSAVEKRAAHSRIEQMAADWGFPVKALSKKLDYATIIDLLSQVALLE